MDANKQLLVLHHRPPPIRLSGIKFYNLFYRAHVNFWNCIFIEFFSSQGKRAWFVQPPSKAETNITDAKEDNSYQEKQSYKQEVNNVASFTQLSKSI